MIVLQLGNKVTTVSNGQFSLQQPTTMQIGVGERVKIGVSSQQHHALYDLVMLLGIKYQNEDFSENTKYYIHNFSRTKNGKIEIILGAYQDMKHRKIHVETLMAIYIKSIVKKLIQKMSQHPIEGESKEEEQQKLEFQFNDLKKSHKFYFILNAGTSHPFRYSMKQICDILQINSPIFLSSPHCHILTYYKTYYPSISPMRSQLFCVVSLGDRSMTTTVYKLHSEEEKIVQALYSSTLPVGSFHFTRLLTYYILECMKKEKGMDIQKNCHYMNVLFYECERAKITLSEKTESVLEREAFVRIPDLPDNSTFGKVVKQGRLEEILSESLTQIIDSVEEVICRFKGIQKILLHGNGSKMCQVQSRIHKLMEKYGIKDLVSSSEVCDSFNSEFDLRDLDLTFFDISEFDYEVTGEQGFRMNFLKPNQDIPMRKCETIRFPSGQLEFNLKVHENGVKIAQFLLDSRPNEPNFGLNFQYDRNKIVDMYVKTSKGKIALPAKFEGLSQDEIKMERKILNDYQ